MRKRWSVRDERVLTEKYGKTDIEWLCEKLKATEKQIHSKAYWMDLERPRATEIFTGRF